MPGVGRSLQTLLKNTTYLRIAAVVIASFLLYAFWRGVLAFTHMRPQDYPINGSPYEYADHLRTLLELALKFYLPQLLISTALMLIDLFIHRKKEVSSIADKLPIVVLMLNLISIGVILDVWVLMIDRNLRGQGGLLPRGAPLLIGDLIIVAVPPALLLACLIGPNLKKPFLISLPIIVMVSLVLKLLYEMVDMKVMF